MKMRDVGVVLGLAVLAGCASEQQMKLTIADPCNQEALVATAQIELRVSSADGNESKKVVWDTASGSGKWSDVPPLNRAVVELFGWSPSAPRGQGTPIAAGSVGYVDLSPGQAGGIPALGLVMGLTDTFVRTTDPSAGSSECTQMLVPRRGHTATLLDDGTVLIVGGDKVGEAAITFWEDTELYDPATSMFRDGPDVRGGRRDHTATRLLDGRVLIVGGVGGGEGRVQTWKVALIYDPASGGFPHGVAMHAQRTGHTATLLDDGRVLIAGGSFEGDALPTTEIFDPATLTSHPGPALADGRYFHSAVLIAPRTVALLGGRNRTDVLGSVELVTLGSTPEEAVTLAGPALTVPRTHAMAALAPNHDAVVVAGGFAQLPEGSVGMGIDALEVLRLHPQDPTQSRVLCGDQALAQPRGAGAMVPLGSGLLIIGGLDDLGDALTSAELLDVGELAECDIASVPTTGSLSEPRAGAVATPLVGGDILMTGGFTTQAGRLESVQRAEVYVRAR